MSSLAALTDACVLYPFTLRDTLLRAAESGLYRLSWSEDILEETRRNLVSTAAATEEAAQTLISVMREVFADAMVAGYEDLIPAMRNHPKDRHVLAASVVGRSQIIVTSNLRDFPPEALEPYGIEAQSPDVFLLHLNNLHPGRLLTILRQQAADLGNPPVAVEELLDGLAKSAPDFASAMRSLL